LSDSHAAIRRFSSRYGLLGHGSFLVSSLNGRIEPNCKIEAIWHWRREIATMRRLIEIWDHADEGHVSELDRFVEWFVRTDGENGPKPVVRWKEPITPAQRADPSSIIPYLQNPILGEAGSSHTPMPSGWQQGDILEPARFYVGHNVNNRLDGHVNPRVMPLEKRDILLWPDCLLSAMYVQFAHEITGKVGRMIECRGCGQRIEQRPASRRYCEPECRQRRYWKVKGYEKAKKRKAEREEG
jgi:hypothetical protein